MRKGVRRLIAAGVCYVCREEAATTGGYCLCRDCYEKYIASKR
jgi:hypothetical protein